MWLIIGYGNVLREDDGAGFHLASRLATDLSPRLVRVLAVHQLTPELALELAAKDVERVLFVDARRSQDKPVVMRPLDPPAAVGSCGHQFAPELLLQMTHSLYGHSAKGWLLTLTARQMSVGDTLSESTQSAIFTADILIKKLVTATVVQQK
ncbi:MAG: hydrogenase maturation protease [Pelovirga sp.]